MPGVWQTVRVFISSTFRDMHAERDHLVKVVFPELRERLERHRIHLVDVDLRWGVTREQAEDDRALDLCLDLIDECRPFFVGILGERYGWVPEAFLEDALCRYGWIQYHTGKSITALEIIHGVLRDPAMKMQSFFYFRDPSFIAEVPAAIRSEVVAEDPQSARKLDELKDAICTADLPVPPMEDYPARFAGLRLVWRLVRMELARADQQALEAAARDGVVAPGEYADLDPHLREIVERYGVVHLTGLEEFGDRVRDDLWAGMCRQYPELVEEPAVEAVATEVQRPTDWLAQEQEYHERLVELRTQVYVGREAIHNRLLSDIAGDDTLPVVVSGPSGSGKSAVLGRLYSELQDREDLAFVLGHFVGASPQSTNLRSMLRRFCLALRERFNLTETEVPEQIETLPFLRSMLPRFCPPPSERFNLPKTVEREGREPEVVPKEVPEEAEKLPSAFRGFLQTVPEGERVVLIIDAPNQLDEAYRAHDLHWLPRELPGHVKIVVSCIAGEEKGDRMLEVLRRRGCQERRVDPLTPEERFEIVTQVPSLWAKTLDPEQVGLLLSNPATQNPLFLLVALEELRGFGFFEHVNARIRAFPSRGDTVTAIFGQVLERLEEEFNAEVARAAVSLIAVSRHGLTERELRELLEKVGTAGDLFVILRQLRPYLLRRGELVDFYHQNLDKAVRRMYLPDEETERAGHEDLARYFESKGSSYLRTLSELPHHQTQGQMWQQLEATLTDLEFMEAKCTAGMVFDLVADYVSASASEDVPEESRGAVQPFARFLRARSHVFALRPDLLVQEAFNFAASGPVHQRGEHLSRSLRHPWLQRINLPLEAPTPCLQTLEGHTSWVRAVALTGDGRRAVTASEDKTVKVWDLETGACLQTLEGGPSWVYAVALTPDGRRAVTPSGENTVKVWDLETGACAQTLEGHTGGVNAVALTGDGRRAVTGGFDKTVKVWDLETGACAQTLEGHTRRVWAVALTPDGRRAVTASEDSTLRVWDLETGACAQTLEGHTDRVLAVVLTRGGRRAVTGSRSLRVWDLETGACAQTLQGHTDRVMAVVLTRDGRRAVTGSRSLRVWDLETGEELACFFAEDDVYDCAVGPDGTHIVAGDYSGNVYLLEAVGFDAGPPLVTGWRSPLDDSIAFGCLLCRRWSAVAESALGTELPCPNCGETVKLNPFTIDGDWRPVAQAWRGNES